MEYKLTLYFGNDQWKLIDALIEDMKIEGKISRYETFKPENIDMIGFHIWFDNIYSVYHFGHRQANSARTYFFNSH